MAVDWAGVILTNPRPGGIDRGVLDFAEPDCWPERSTLEETDGNLFSAAVHDVL